MHREGASATGPDYRRRFRLHGYAPLLAYTIAISTLLGMLAHAAQTDCQDWQECRQLAVAAAERGEYETFHDLAWRTVQKGRAGDPGLMLLLARAQSLSGRPHDALVMLRRLAEMGVAVDVAGDEDFRRTRALREWPAVEALIRTVTASRPSTAAGSERAAEETAASDQPVAARATPAGPISSAPLAVPRYGPEAAESVDSAVVSAAVSPTNPPAMVSSVEDIVHFTGGSVEAGGLAYDAVSGRFLVAHRGERKIVVVGEESGRAVDLVRAESAGFHEIAAIEIDHRRGDLWVVSADENDGSGRVASVHKLQLVSGRLLHTIAVAPEHQPARFTDVAVTRNGTLLVLDRDGHRIFRIRPGARVIDVALGLGAIAPTSLAPAGDERTIYIAHRGGLVRANLASRTVTSVAAGKGVDITGLMRVRWHRGTLVGIQEQPDGTRCLARLALDRAGSVVVGLEILDPSIPSDPRTIAATLAADDWYYLDDSDGSGAQAIRRIRLR